MRTIAEISHPICKITVFNMNQKYIIKFELGPYEQCYKIAEMDLTGGGVEEIKQLIDEEFIDRVVERFSNMRSDFSAAYQRL